MDSPGESIQDKLAFRIPSDAIAIKLTLQFISSGITWTAVDFIPCNHQMNTRQCYNLAALWKALEGVS